MTIIDVKAEVRNALLADSDLVEMLGGNKVYSVLSPKAVDFPYVTLQEVGNQGLDYGDNSPTRSEINLQVDVWSQNDYTDIVAKVDDVLTGLGYVRYYSTDLFEFDTRVLHKPLRYWIAKELS